MALFSDIPETYNPVLRMIRNFISIEYNSSLMPSRVTVCFNCTGNICD